MFIYRFRALGFERYGGVVTRPAFVQQELQMSGLEEAVVKSRWRFQDVLRVLCML